MAIGEMRKVGAKSVCFNMRRLSCEQTVDRLLDQCPKAVASKLLCCGCLECCHLVHIWFPSFLKSPTLFHDHDLILKIPFFFRSCRQKAQSLICCNNRSMARLCRGTGHRFLWMQKLDFVSCAMKQQGRKIFSRLL